MPVSRWHHAENRRREALRAAHQQDAAVLIDLLQYYLSVKSRKAGLVSASTVRSYSLAVRDFLTFCGPADRPRHALNQLDTEVVEAYLRSLRERSLQLTSIRTYLYGVRALFRALHWAGAVGHDPARDVRPPFDPTPAHTRKPAIPLGQVARLLTLPRELAKDERVAWRDEVLLTLGVTLGLRASEMVALDVQDVDLQVMDVHIRRGKGGRARRVPLTRSVGALLDAWLRVRAQVSSAPSGGEAPLLISFRPGRPGARLSARGLSSIVNGYLAAAGLPKDMSGVHTLRRTAGTRLYRATRDLHVVSDLLGHASVTTSAIYAKMDTDIRREALERIESM